MSKIGVGGVKLAMTEKGAGGCQAALCGERLSGAMACGREGRIPVAVSPTQWSKHDPVSRRNQTQTQ